MSALKIVIVGGNGKIAKRLTRLLSPPHEVTSIIRSESQAKDIASLGPTVKPLVLSIENAPKGDFTPVFEGADVVYFTAGAGGKPGENGEAAADRTKKVDLLGAIKVFDAIEEVQGPKPRLIMVSAIDTRDINKIPSHYTEQDIAHSQQSWKAIKLYRECKYEADKNLIQRTAFRWTIVRPGGLTDDEGTGKVRIGKTHLGAVTRDDVAAVLFEISSRPDADGLALDLVGGEEPIRDQLDAFISRRESDFEP